MPRRTARGTSHLYHPPPTELASYRRTWRCRNRRPADSAFIFIFLNDRHRPLQRATALRRMLLLQRGSQCSARRVRSARAPKGRNYRGRLRSPTAPSAAQQRRAAATEGKRLAPFEAGQIRRLPIATSPMTDSIVGHERGIQVQREAELSFARCAPALPQRYDSAASICPDLQAMMSACYSAQRLATHRVQHR